MIDGDPKVFIDELYYGAEHTFLYNGGKYFVQSYLTNDDKRGKIEIYNYDLETPDLYWCAVNEHGKEVPVKEFEKAKLFNGKTFWEVEQEITWTDD